MLKKKLIRVTTSDISLDILLKGQLKFLSSFYDVTGVASDSGRLKSISDREKINVVDIPMERKVSLKRNLKSLFSLYRLFKKIKPDIVHANTPMASLLSMVAAWLARVPYRVYLVTGLRYQGATGLFRLILKTTERITCLFATNVIPEGQGVLHCLKHDHITTKPLAVLHFGNINGKDTVYYSREQTSADLCSRLSVHDDTSVNGVRNLLRNRLGFGANDFVFVFVGRVNKDKGINELADSMSALEKFAAEEQSVLCSSNGAVFKYPKLLIVGPYEETLDPLKKSTIDFLKNSPNVVCVGQQDDIRPYLMASDTLVLPSYREGFPNAPLEAGCMELPCIVTDINGSNEIIKDGLNGKIIESALGNGKNGSELMQRALFNTMKWFLLHPSEVKRMSRNARGLIISRYDQKDVWNALLNFYDNLDKNK